MAINNPNNSSTWRRRGGAERTMDNDFVDNEASDADYFGNLKKFERHDNMADAPNRKDYDKKSGPV